MPGTQIQFDRTQQGDVPFRFLGCCGCVGGYGPGGDRDDAQAAPGQPPQSVGGRGLWLAAGKDGIGAPLTSTRLPTTTDI